MRKDILAILKKSNEEMTLDDMVVLIGARWKNQGPDVHLVVQSDEYHAWTTYIDRNTGKECDHWGRPKEPVPEPRGGRLNLALIIALLLLCSLAGLYLKGVPF
jgi:hypothetical protein